MRNGPTPAGSALAAVVLACLTVGCSPARPAGVGGGGEDGGGGNGGGGNGGNPGDAAGGSGGGGGPSGCGGAGGFGATTGSFGDEKNPWTNPTVQCHWTGDGMREVVTTPLVIDLD